MIMVGKRCNNFLNTKKTGSSNIRLRLWPERESTHFASSRVN